MRGSEKEREGGREQERERERKRWVEIVGGREREGERGPAFYKQCTHMYNALHMSSHSELT